jgi:prophage antirepressor-like protein
VVDPEGARLAAEGSRRPKAREFGPWLDRVLPTLPQAAPPPPEPERDPEAVFWDNLDREMEEQARALVAAKEQEEAEPPPAGRGIVPFEFEGAAVRIVMRGDDPWFVLADVCQVLEIANSRDAAARLHEDDKGVAITDTLRGGRHTGSG